MGARRSRPYESKIAFPWERRRMRLVRFSRRNLRILAGVSLLAAAMVLVVREHRSVQAQALTRAEIRNVISAVTVWRVDHADACPPSVEALTAQSPGGRTYLAHAPVDAWGRPFRMVCPGRKHPSSADVLSGGPSGAFDGLSVIE